MAEAPWISIIGLGEDGLEGLGAASQRALSAAEVIMGPPRHLALVPDTGAERIEWPQPFADGIAVLQGLAGRHVAVLASGDPFWFGAGSSIAAAFDATEWQSFPAPSTFSLIANRLGWALGNTTCLGLHAAPMTRLRPYLTPRARLIVTLREGGAVTDLVGYLIECGFGDSQVMVFEAMGGPREKVQSGTAQEIACASFGHPVTAAIEVAGKGAVLPAVSGLADDLFETDGVMTKRAVRAITLSSLAPKPGECLWDLGAGSGSIAIEWLLADPTCRAVAVEPRADRVALITRNAIALGVDRLQIVEARTEDVLLDLPQPDAIFIGGGLSADLLATLRAQHPGVRAVANAVTLEGEALLSHLHKETDGELMRIDIAQGEPLGAKRGWKAAYPVVQWSGVL